MGSYNAKPSTSDEKTQTAYPATTAKTIDSQNSHPFTIEETSDTDENESHKTKQIGSSPLPVKDVRKPTALRTQSEAVMQDEQRQRELAQERLREESRAPSGSSGESVSPYGLYNPLGVSEGGRPYPALTAAHVVAGGGMNPSAVPLIQYSGPPAPPLVAINPTTAAVLSPYPSAFTSPTAAIYSGLHSSSAVRPYHGIESYSAMLASMGNQAAQQHLQGHLIPAGPSYFQGGYIPAQYSTHISPLMTGVVPTTKGTFPEGTYLPSGSDTHVLTGILPSGSGSLNPIPGSHPDQSGGRSSPEKHYQTSVRYLEAREREILESRRLAEIQQHQQQLSPSAQVHRSIPEARVSPFQQVIPGATPKSVHMPSKDVMLHTSMPKQSLGEVGSARQVQLTVLPNTFYCGSVPGQAMVATTEGTIRVELPPPTIGINIMSNTQQLGDIISKPLTIASGSLANTGGSIFTFPASSLPPLTSIASVPGLHASVTPSTLSYQGSTSKHQSPTYASAVPGPQSWQLSPSPQVRTTPTVRFQSTSQGSTSSRQGEDQQLSAQEVQLHHQPRQGDSTQTSPSSHHRQHQRHHSAPSAAPKSSSTATSHQQPHHHQQTNTLPSYFTRGSIIQLANSVLKRVEDLTTDDFVQSAGSTDGLKIDSSTVLRIDEEPHRGLALIGFLVGEHKAQVTVEAPYEHPFFVFGQGWSSVRPELSLKSYGLQCHPLAVGDVCVSLTVIENSKQGMKEEFDSDTQMGKLQMQSFAGPEQKRPRLEEKSQVQRYTEQREHGHLSGGVPDDTRPLPMLSPGSSAPGSQLSSASPKQQHAHASSLSHSESHVGISVHPERHAGTAGQEMHVSTSCHQESHAGTSGYDQQHASTSGHHKKHTGTSSHHEVHTGIVGHPEIAEHGIDKNFNIVQEKPEMPHMKLMRPPKRRWSDPVKASQEGGEKEQEVQEHSVPPETIGKVQQLH